MQGAAIFQEHVLSTTTVDGAVWRFSRPDQKPAHFHGQLEFVMILRGHALERIGQKAYAIHARQLIWHLPGIEHELIQASSDLDLRVVHVEPDLAAALCNGSAAGVGRTEARAFSGWVQGLGRLAAGRPVIELKRNDHDALLEHCDVPSTDCDSADALASRLGRALFRAWQATRDDHDTARAPSLVEQACCLLLEEPWLERPAVCRALDVSEGYLSRRFQSELGVSFLEQRARLRVVRFITHVVRDRQSFLDAALQAGFGSYSQLHRVFVKLIGMGPRTYLSRDMRNERGRISASDSLASAPKVR